MINMSAVWLNTTANLVYAVSIKEPRLMMTFSNSFVSLSSLLLTTLYYRYVVDVDIDVDVDVSSDSEKPQ
jgi:hypothetical protein